MQVKKLPQGRHSDGRGLYLYVQGGSRIWVYRYTDANKKRREMSLGPVETMSLKEARDRRDELVVSRRSGADPMRGKALEAEAEKAANLVRSERYLGRVIFSCFEARQGDLKNGGEAGRWMSPLNTHIISRIGLVDITQVGIEDLLSILQPIWRTKVSAAEKTFQRMGLVMKHANAKFPGEIDNTLMERLGELLGSQAHKVVHIPSMPWAEVPTFYASLGPTPTELAMRLLILTASRSAPVRFAREEQFEGDVWSIPAENMKDSRPFRVPLSDEAQRVVEMARPLARDGFLFCAYRGKPISDAAMAKYLNRRDLTYRPHGFRATFKTWAEDKDMPWKPTEMSLSHKVGSEVERSYARSDLLERRRALMQQWSDYVTGPGA